MIAPNMNPPKMAWMPIVSVANALASTSRNTIATRFWESRPVRSTMALSRLSSGRTRTSMAATYARTRTRVRPAPPRSALPTTATTKASRHHAVTSSTAAHTIVTAPTFVFSRSRSVRMRARTGKAVIDIEAPMKSAKDRKRTPWGACSWYSQAASPMPSANGVKMLECEVTTAARPRPRMSAGSSSSPTRNMKKTIPYSLSTRR